MRLYRRQQFLQQYNMSCAEHILISVGELNENKNHLSVVRAIAELNDDNIHYFIAGQGELADEIKQVSKELGIAKQVHLLGYRNDIVELLRMADAYVLPSQREGLNVSLMEAIASKVPVICSKIRGNIDLVKNNEYVFRSNDVDEIKQCISIVLNRDSTQVVMENYNTLLKYDLSNVVAHMNEHYKGIFEAGGVMRLYRRQQFLQQYGISCNEHILISVGELNKNKNHETIIRAIAKLKNPAIHYFIAGQGCLKESLEHLVEELGVSKQVHLLGYRNDVVELLKMADVFCFPSKREGLGLAAIEAMACGLPLITSYIHGIKDYSISGVTGYSCKPNDVDGFAQAISKMISSKDMQEKMKFYNLEYVRKFSIDIVREQMKILYAEYLN